jgi:hypothetical protein
MLLGSSLLSSNSIWVLREAKNFQCQDLRLCSHVPYTGLNAAFLSLKSLVFWGCLLASPLLTEFFTWFSAFTYERLIHFPVNFSIQMQHACK